MIKKSRIFAFFAILIMLGALIGLTAKPQFQKVNLGLDLQGGFEVLYQLEPVKAGQKLTEETVKSTAQTLSKRVNVLGVSEPIIQVESGNRIRVQLAGVKDPAQARTLLSTSANLTIRDVHDKVLLDGSDLKENGASQGFDDKNAADVILTLKDANKFAKVTKQISSMPKGQNLLVIWMDFEEGKDHFIKEAHKKQHKYISAASVNEVINSETVQITGGFKVEEAKEMADLLNSGSLPVKLKEIYSNSVGAQFGQDSLKDTVYAGVVGFAAIAVFMLFAYRLPGLIANIMLVAYVYITVVAFNFIGGVLTLPGIAALILGVGMSVDANIIMYERIKEELRIGRSVKRAYASGAKSSFLTIFDANITTVIAAAVLFIFGTSSVKGFATLLLLSIVIIFITAIAGTRLLLSLLVNSNLLNKKTWLFGVSKKRIHKLSDNVHTLNLTTRFDRFSFVKHAKKFFALSLLLLCAGGFVTATQGLNLGVDFSSGTRIDVVSKTALTTNDVKKDFEMMKVHPEKITMSTDNKTATIIVKKTFTEKQSIEVKQYLEKKYHSEPTMNSVSPVIGKELAVNALYALGIASIGIIIYVAIRFEWAMGLTAVLALLHDALIIIFIFSLIRVEVDITFIAAVLTIIGYSINDTIVTFDRVREHLQFKKVIKSRKQIDSIVDMSLRQTLTRSINTILTVLIMVVAMIFLGSPAILPFNIALLIGLIFGLYSSLFIAVQLWGIIKKREIKKKGKLNFDYEEKYGYNNDKVVV